MTRFEMTNGSRKVVGFSNDGKHFSSRLYVNHGETATLTCASHKSRKGAEAWARKILSRYDQPGA